MSVMTPTRNSIRIVASLLMAGGAVCSSLTAAAAVAPLDGAVAKEVNCDVEAVLDETGEYSTDILTTMVVFPDKDSVDTSQETASAQAVVRESVGLEAHADCEMRHGIQAGGSADAFASNTIGASAFTASFTASKESLGSSCSTEMTSQPKKYKDVALGAAALSWSAAYIPTAQSLRDSRQVNCRYRQAAQANETTSTGTGYNNWGWFTSNDKYRVTRQDLPPCPGSSVCLYFQRFNYSNDARAPFAVSLFWTAQASITDAFCVG